jgi:hypothetical protein
VSGIGTAALFVIESCIKYKLHYNYFVFYTVNRGSLVLEKLVVVDL